jgi:FkbM family methyltransferase
MEPSVDGARRGVPTRVASAVAGRVPASWLHPVSARLNRRAEPEMRAVVERCDPTGRALDVGAWYGPWTYWLSRRVAWVEAFEPNPTVAAALRTGARPNVVVHEVAASEADGTAELVVPTPGLGSEGTASIERGVRGATTHLVRTVRLDSHDFEDVRFVKIDVEGHERAVLRGASRLLATQFPVVLVELDVRHADIAGSTTLLEDLGYEGRVLVDGAWHRLASIDLATMQRDFHARHAPQSYLQTVLRPKGYVNDVAFVHPSSTWSPWD